MRSILILLVLATAVFGQSKVSVLQGEYILNKVYQPDYSKFPGLKFVDGTPSTSKAFPGISDHATRVTQILASGGTDKLIQTLTLSEAVTFMGRGGLNQGRTLEPTPSTWEIESQSWGGSDPLGENDQTFMTIATNAAGAVLFGPDGQRLMVPITVYGVLNKEKQRIERDNILLFVGPPDAGMQKYRLLDAVQSANCVKVGSLQTGMVIWAENTPDVYVDIAWTSYAIPTAANLGIRMISWCKDNHIAYKAADLRTLMIQTATLDDKGRRVLNPTATLAALPIFYHTVVAPTPLPPPPPPTPVELKSAAAGSSGALYNTANDTFTVSATNLPKLVIELKNRGL